jgi:exopolysaccharide biosynthesis polyprenyl glycosylphosphotransferase
MQKQMATSEFWQRLSASVSSLEREVPMTVESSRVMRGTAKFWVAFDVATVFAVAAATTMFKLKIGLITVTEQFLAGRLFGREALWNVALLSVFTVSLILTSKRLHLYTPERISNTLNEQRMSLQACFTAGLVLTGTLYLDKGVNVPRTVVLVTVGLVAVLLGVRRLLYRLMLYHSYDRGVSTRNVLIVGTGPAAHALRHHLESIRHLGYTFKGFVEMPGSDPASTNRTQDIIGTYDTLFEQARALFVDEIFYTSPCEQGMMQNALELARVRGVDLRIIPDMFDGLAWNSPIEYIGQFPTIPLHRGHVPELGLIFKRGFDVLFSLLFLLVFSPLLLIVAILVRLDSPGPALYRSERIGKKGRVFKCIKFRTMVQGADKRRDEVAHMNERDGVLFKVSNDPRITKLGHFLRKYSLDELPQFFNVLKGDMSVVGPRPPIASEVKEYKLSHLRRLDVTPGITGLWQVQGRQDPSFASYVSMDVNYIDNWSIWLDFKIIMRTVGVVFAGTGS